MTTTEAASAPAATAPASRFEELTNQIKSIKSSINDLEKSLKDVNKEVTKSLKEAGRHKRQKRERTGPYTPSAGQQAWNAYVAKVREELQKTNAAATYKDAMIEAKNRRSAGDKEAPVASASKKAPKAAKAAAPVAAATPAPVAAAAKPAKAAAATKAPKAKVIKA
jgi:uncharacterized surface anchored protein